MLIILLVKILMPSYHAKMCGDDEYESSIFEMQVPWKDGVDLI